MRTFKAILFLLTLFLFVAPAPAQAWFGWLDNFSGPGPFNGAEFDFKILCFMSQPSPQQAVAASTTANALAQTFLAPSQGTTFTQSSARNALSVVGREADQVPYLKVELMKLSREAALTNASQVEELIDFLKKRPVPDDQKAENIAHIEALEMARDSWLGRAVPAVSMPSVVLWASCSDRLHHEPADLVDKNTKTVTRVQHGDRHPVISIVLNYRDLANTAGIFHQLSEVARDGTDAIHLRIFEPKLSWPMSGHFDFLDGQAGAGIYQFSSAGFRTGAKSFSGFVFEPMRLDFHAPGLLVDKYATHQNGFLNFLIRIPLSMSYSAGFLLFPKGFSADKFVGDNPTTPGRDISGGEAIFEQGVVLNVGRLFGL